jgi:hypothetical protein
LTTVTKAAATVPFHLDVMLKVSLLVGVLYELSDVGCVLACAMLQRIPVKRKKLVAGFSVFQFVFSFL